LTDQLCLCGCEQPRSGDYFSKGCRKRIGHGKANKLIAEVRAKKQWEAGSKDLTYRCTEHPDWQTTDRGERDHHFKREHTAVVAKTTGPTCSTCGGPAHRAGLGYISHEKWIAMRTKQSIATARRHRMAAAV
jgi:hypothetical protein